MSRVSRRQVIHGAWAIGLALLAGCGRFPWQAQTQQPAKVARIGWLGNGLPDSHTQTQVEALREGLQSLGYVEGQNILIEYRWADGYSERLPTLAAELASLPVDVIVTAGTASIRAVQEATSSIPIVMPTSVDPVGSGLIASLARPGGNVTGLSAFLQGLPGKRLELLKETLPGISRVGILWHPNVVDRFTETQAAAQALGVQLVSLEVHGPDDFDAVFEKAVQARIEALLPLESPLVIAYRPRVVDFAVNRRLPSMYTSRVWVADGGLMAYGIDVLAHYRRAAIESPGVV